jgi:hypothetical protein
MLWDPSRALDDLMMEYANYHFGREAAPEMVRAAKQLEINLESDLSANPGIDRYYGLVKSAGWKIPSHLMKRDYRWREHMQKAALDKYLQLKLRDENERASEIAFSLSRAESAGPAACADALHAARERLAQPSETSAMSLLREEARRLGEESDSIFGVRNTGYFSLDGDLTDLGWLRNQIQAAAELTDPEAQLAHIRSFRSYEDAGYGGFYDDAGDPTRQSHLLPGAESANLAFVRSRLDPANRSTANSFVYRYDAPIEFRYEGLDSSASYRVRLTLVAPRPGSQTSGSTQPRIQSVFADDLPIARDVEVPFYTAHQFEYAVPDASTKDGSVTLRIQSQSTAEAPSAAVVSEVWLLKNS